MLICVSLYHLQSATDVYASHIFRENIKLYWMLIMTIIQLVVRKKNKKKKTKKKKTEKVKLLGIMRKLWCISIILILKTKYYLVKKKKHTQKNTQSKINK